MKKISFRLPLLLFVIAAFTVSAQTDSTRYGVKLLAGYSMPISGSDFTRYYSGSPDFGLRVGMKFHSTYAVFLGSGYSKFPLYKLQDYVAWRGSRMLVNAPPYTDLVGGSLRIISIEAGVKKNFPIGSSLALNTSLAPSFSFIEKAPVDGTDSTGTYQILQHFVHEKPLGINIGTGADYSSGKHVEAGLELRYKMLFDSYVTDHTMGIFSVALGITYKF